MWQAASYILCRVYSGTAIISPGVYQRTAEWIGRLAHLIYYLQSRAYQQMIRVAPPTQGTWRSNDYVSAVRFVDYWLSMEWVGEMIIYIWSDWHKHARPRLSSHSQHHIPNTSWLTTSRQYVSKSFYILHEFTCISQQGKWGRAWTSKTPQTELINLAPFSYLHEHRVTLGPQIV